MSGTAFVFGDNINTGYITPASVVSKPMDAIIEHLFQPVDPSVAVQIEPGDFVVAGQNFGSGSSHETGPAALAHANVNGMIAESFARIFYRNAIAIGLPAITASGITEYVSTGDQLTVDLDAGIIENRTTRETIPCESLPKAVQGIFDAGGLLAHYDDNPKGLRNENV